MNLVVTTAHKPTPEMVGAAAELAERLAAPLKPRGNASLDALRRESAVDTLLVVTKRGPVVSTPGGEYFFHLNLAELRIKNLISGKPDHMVSAMDLAAGMTVLDCTLGLATDAIVAAYVAGAAGKVVGLESSAVIAAVTGLGLARFVSDQAGITAALRQIRVLNADFNQHLLTLPDRSFDIVFFDPMFRAPIIDSSNLKPLRFLADDRPLSCSAVREACRVARRRVVMKEKNGSPEFARLGITDLYGGKYSSVQYGVIAVGG
ncbi:MAG: class I SAM-dependent methyltransferase [Negativicutes bacterium]|nr:class I SAM-dependent methyltransferase [Negativicutes bacterium]